MTSPLVSATLLATLRAAFLSAVFAAPANAQAASPVLSAPLGERIRLIAAEAHGTVSVACSLPGTALSCDLHPTGRPPMQSVFKLPLAMALLHAIETGRLPGLTLESTVGYQASDQIPHTHSPLHDKYPNAGVLVPLREVLRLTVTESDNDGSEILLRLVGGPAAVTEYITGLGTHGFTLLTGERPMATDERVQYRNTWEPRSAVFVLNSLRDGKALNPADTAFILDLMRNTSTGPNRLKAGLPADAVLRHKTGSSGVVDGLDPATNDIGLITLPDGRILTLAVFVTDAHAPQEANESVIARIAAACYQAALEAR